MFVQVYYILFPALTLQQSAAGDITTTCPSSYVEAMDSHVNCTVDLTVFTNTTCNNNPIEVLFFFTPNSSNAEQFWCSTSIQNCGSTKRNDDDACNNCSCGCLDDSTSTAAEYQLIFKPEQQTHAGGTFLCKISCFFPTSQPTSSNVNCSPIGTIMPQPTTQPPASTNASPTTAQTSSDTTASTNAPTTDTTGGGCPPGSTCAYAVGFGVTVGVIIIIVIIVIVVKVKPC